MEKITTDEFVTIVSVGSQADQEKNGVLLDQAEARRHTSDTPFVTVLSIGQQAAEEEVIVYRLPGEKLGFGLKFEGGTKSAERVRRLFIQSCAAESPAGRAKASWGSLTPGDEILKIDHTPVETLTRLECVRCLKDSNVAVKLLVRHAPDEKPFDEENHKSALPPPVPPRKIPRRLSKDSGLSTNGSDRGVDIHDGTAARKVPLGKQSPGRPRRQAPGVPPPEAQVYTDLFCHEKENGRLIAESESDDTGSSISTVIDKMSTYSSFPGSVDNSIPSTPTLGLKQMNLHNVLTSIESLDDKFINEFQVSLVEDKPLAKSTPPPIKKQAVELSNAKPIINKIDPKAIDQKSTIISNDSNNNTNKITPPQKEYPVATERTTTKVTKTNVTVVEAPKPLPRNLSKKNLDHLQNTYQERTYDDNLSPTKLHCIESWLQESIACKVEDEPPSAEAQVPEALPRLIDFVPKTPNVKADEIVAVKPVATERTKRPPILETPVIEEPPGTPETTEEWMFNDTVPQLDTIYEGYSPNLLIDDSDRHPPAGDSGSDRGSQDTKETVTEISVLQERAEETPIPPEPKSVLPSASKSTSDLKECGVVIVTRGPRPPPDGRENPIVHLENQQSVDETDNFHHQAPIEKIINENYKTQISINHSSEIREIKPIEQIRKPFEPSPGKTYGRSKDVKSEGSVKDKIAMFSVKKTIESANYNGSEKKTNNIIPKPTEFKSHVVTVNNRTSLPRSNYRSRSQENLLDYDSPSTQSVIHEKNSFDWNIPSVQKPYSMTFDDRPSDNGSISSEVERNGQSKISPIDLLNKKLAITRTESVDDSELKTRRATLDHLIEQRRQSMSKLRGLVIPESSCISNLPEIKCRDSLKLITTNNSKPASDKSSYSLKNVTSPTITTPPNTPSTIWDNSSLLNNIPKYSPAFKRKPLQLYGPNANTAHKYTNSVNSDKCIESAPIELKKSTTPLKPPRTSLDGRNFDLTTKVSTLPANFTPNFITSSSFLKSSKTRSDTLDMDDLCKIGKGYPETFDSDNDSAVSSNQSSYLSTLSSPTPSLNTVDNTESDCSSQPISLSRDHQARYDSGRSFLKCEDGALDSVFSNCLSLNDDIKRPVCRSLSSDTSTSAASSNSSTLTSGSQASCSSAASSKNDSNRVLNPRSIEAINRKNILASAKCRSGKDLKYGSPLIERKFSDDSNVESTDECEPRKHDRYITGDKLKLLNMRTKSKIENALPNSIVKVAYTNIIEDKCSKTKREEIANGYSDTGTDSDIEPIALIKLDTKPSKSKKYSNGIVDRTKSNELAAEKKLDSVAKLQPERVKPKRSTVSANQELSRKISNGDVPSVENVTSNGIGYKKVGDSGMRKSGCCGDSDDDPDNRFEVKLCRGSAGGVGVTLAGGIDCEAKEITIHKVLQGSVAEKDGQLRKGDRIISINGQSMRGLTHAETVAILRDPRPEVMIVVKGKRLRNETVTESTVTNGNVKDEGAVISVELVKADSPGGAGLGISLQGGGDEPLLINKIFTGGAAARSGCVVSGSELLAAGDIRLIGMTRTEAWGLLRSLPAGPVKLLLRPP